jgi:hypothetical protein
MLIRLLDTRSEFHDTRCLAPDSILGGSGRRTIFRAHQLVSLLDMKNFFADAFAEGWRVVENYRYTLEAGVLAGKPYGSGAPIPPELLARLRDEAFPTLRKAFASCELAGSVNTIDCTLRDLPKLSLGELKRDLEQLQNGVETELKARRFMYVPPDQAACFDLGDGFGPEVAQAFPSATFDIREAGNAYAADLFTPSVFHAMRALEPALMQLARNVGVKWKNPESVTWGEAIRKTEERINTVLAPKAKTKHQRARNDFLSEAVKEFRVFKEAWRDNAAHGRLKEAEKQDAEKVLIHARLFMLHLSSRLHEPGAAGPPPSSQEGSS